MLLGKRTMTTGSSYIIEPRASLVCRLTIGGNNAMRTMRGLIIEDFASMHYCSIGRTRARNSTVIRTKDFTRFHNRGKDSGKTLA